MTILKASEVIYIDPEADRLLAEMGEHGPRPESLDHEGGFIYGAPIIIGNGMPIDWQEIARQDSDDGYDYVEVGEMLMGREIVIGGGFRRREQRERQGGLHDGEADSYDYAETPTDFGYDETPIQAVDLGPTESEQLIEKFSNFLDTPKSELDLADLEMLGEGTAILRQVDDKVKQLIDEYRGNLQDASGNVGSFLSGTQRERLLSEAVRQVGEKRDMKSVDQVVEFITGKINSLAAQKQEEILLTIEEQRVATMGRIETYVEDTVDSYRQQVRQEAQDFVTRALDEQRRKLENDHELLNAANSIIEDREHILDEAYKKALGMVSEAESEVQRLHADMANAEETSRRIFADAEEKAGQIRNDAQREAERIISEANLESARIIEQAEQSHQEIIEAATQEGFNVGYQEGREEAVKENAQLLAETTTALNKLHGAFPHAVKQNEEKLVRLSMEVAEAVIGEELAARPEIALKTVERAIKRVSDLERVTIKVNPLDLDLILPKQEYFRNLLPDVSEFVITGHYSIARGGALIETNSGTVDAQISTQLAVLDEVFAKVRSEYDDVES